MHFRKKKTESYGLMAPLNATEFKAPIYAGREKDDARFSSRIITDKNDKYFYFYHSDGESMLLENSVSLDKNAALYTALAYVNADLNFEFPRNITT